MSMPLNPIEAFMRGQAIVPSRSVIDDSRELLVDELMTMIDNGLHELVDTDPHDLAHAVTQAAAKFEAQVSSFHNNEASGDTLLVEGSRLMGLITASYAQVLRIAEANQSSEGEDE